MLSATTAKTKPIAVPHPTSFQPCGRIEDSRDNLCEGLWLQSEKRHVEGDWAENTPARKNHQQQQAERQDRENRVRAHHVERGAP